MLLAPAVALLLLLGSSLAESLALHAAAPAVDLTTVFTSGEKDERGFAINSFRIPGFTVANTTLVVAAEARLYSYEDLSPHHLVVKRSTNNGQTWGPLQTVVSPSQFAGGTVGRHGDVFYDPTPVFDARRSQIHLIFAYQASRYIDWSTCTRLSNRTGPSTVGDYLGCSERNMSDPLGQQLFSVSSSDTGATWSEPRNLSFAGRGPNWCGMSGAGGGSGIQLTRSGRLLVPGYHAGCGCRAVPKGVLGPSCMHSHVLIADTHSSAGPNWRMSKEFFPGSAEGSLAELPAAANPGARAGEDRRATTDERLIFVARLERNQTHCVPSAAHCAGVAFSSNEGLSWGDEVDNGHLLDPRCKNTVAKMTTSSGRQLLVHSGSASAQVGPRVNITCLFSEDGKAWTDPIAVLPSTDAAGHSQIGGYSAVQGLPGSTHAGVVLEAQLPPAYHLDIFFTVVAAPASAGA